MTGRAIAVLVVSVGVLGSQAAAELPAPGTPTPKMTPERVRDLVLLLEREMDALVDRELRTYPTHLSGARTCHGTPVDNVIKKADATRSVRSLLQEPALSCYLTTYLGCDLGTWLGIDISPDGRFPVEYKPFSLSKVTIVEQTSDRVTADVQEISFEDVDNGVAGNWTDEEPRPYTSKDLEKWKLKTSRYTISKGADGVWRISDRKPPFAWECKSRY